ncbi:MAG TPA: fluoride efflux transporter CrcB [Deltaproteobacteria bacterium]|nr:fluoride efflux transporter CrcB [Deltaproteobacteria bacterium]
MRWLLLFIGGGIGTIFRYQLSGLVQDQLGSAFPWGTFVVNVTGCLAIGLLATLADERGMLGSPARLFLMVGLTGGYTTFSTFGLETWRLLQAGEFAPAFANAVGSVVVGLIGLFIGVFLGRLAL